MLHQSSQKSNRYQEQKAARIAQAISTLEIKSDPWGIFAVMPSTSKKLAVYVTVIEDGKASRCDCPGNKEYGHYCVHMIATQTYLDALVEDAESVTLAEAMEEAQAEMEAYAEEAIAEDEVDIEEVAAEAERENMRKLAEHKLASTYEEIGPTKQITSAVIGSCGHWVKPGHEHEMCGGCYQKSYM
jgi:uncharacterized Zn finger protein